MTEVEKDKKIQTIQDDANLADVDKKRRIGMLEQTYSAQQDAAAAKATERQQAAERNLKETMRTAYMKNPVATEESFEADFPALKSEHLRSSALKADTAARNAQARYTKETF